MPTLILVRGLPGSGKTTLAEMMTDTVLSADQFFIDNEGAYNFDESKIAEAHQWCIAKTRRHMTPDWMGHRTENVAIANTFTQRWEMEPYISMALELGYRVTVISLFDNGLSDEQLFVRNTHDVPLDIIRDMRKDYEHDWRKKNEQPLTKKYNDKVKALKEEYGEDAVARDILKTFH